MKLNQIIINLKKMRWADRLLLPLAVALVVACGATMVHYSAIQTQAKAETGKSEKSTQVALPILMYHHILKEPSRLNDYTISPEEFRGDIVYLKEQGYSFVVMEDVIGFVKEGTPLPPKPVMITFDDGYESFHEYAFPILKELNVKAVFSVVGKYADQYSQTEDHHIRYSHATWNQLCQMQESGLVEIQNHSYDLHTNDQGRQGARRKSGEDLAAYTQLLCADLGKLQDLCDEYLGMKPTAFTYPFGYIGKDTEPILKDLGFVAALTCEEKVNYLTGEEEQLFHLRRFNRPHGKSAEAILG